MVPPTLHTSHGGYLLRLPTEATDTQRFERLTQHGRAAFEAGRLETAADTLRAALQIWRGRALTDVGLGTVLEAESVRLEELRKSVLKERVDIDLLLGRHHHLVSELSGIVAHEPTHEGFQAKLMLSLYRVGRRSEALQVYQRARTVLGDELGLEPSSELQHMHASVLAADPSLDAPIPTARLSTTRIPGTPGQLPPDVRTLVGRADELKRVRAALNPGQRATPPLATISGAPGVGTSAFTVHVAHGVRANFPDGQLYATLMDDEGHAVAPSEVLAQFLRGLGATESEVPASLDERAKLFRSWTMEQRMLVVLDDVTSIRQVYPLLPAGAGCATLVSSRRRLASEAISLSVGLKPLANDDSERLLADLLGKRSVDDNLSMLVEACGGLPLLMQHVRTWLSLRPHWSIARLLTELCRQPTLLFHPPGDHDCAEASVWRTYAQLSSAAQLAFTVLAPTAQQALSVHSAAAGLEINEDHAESLLEELVEFHLVEVAQSDAGSFCYRFPAVFRAAADVLGDDPAIRRWRPVCAGDADIRKRSSGSKWSSSRLREGA